MRTFWQYLRNFLNLQIQEFKSWRKINQFLYIFFFLFAIFSFFYFDVDIRHFGFDKNPVSPYSHLGAGPIVVESSYTKAKFSFLQLFVWSQAHDFFNNDLLCRCRRPNYEILPVWYFYHFYVKFLYLVNHFFFHDFFSWWFRQSYFVYYFTNESTSPLMQGDMNKRVSEILVSYVFVDFDNKLIIFDLDSYLHYMENMDVFLPKNKQFINELLNFLSYLKENRLQEFIQKFQYDSSENASLWKIAYRLNGKLHYL